MLRYNLFARAYRWGKAEFNKETLEAFEESERISKDPNAKSYTDVKEMFREILEDEA